MTSYDETLEVTCELLRRHVEGSRAIHPGDSIQHDLGLDSLAMMELVSDVESRFQVNIPSDLFEKISTVEDVAKIVVTLKG